MKLLTICLVTALIAFSSATPWGSRANKQCAAYCKEANKFSYDVGTIYSYDYTAEAASKVAGTSDEESRLHISAVAEFEVVSPCELILRMKQVNLQESDPSDASVRMDSARSTEFTYVLQQHPLIFSFQDGQVEHLCPSTDEPVWALNIKRGVLSAMQNSMQDIAIPQGSVYETDVVGHCETNYTVMNHGRSGVTVSRRKDLLACTGRNSQHSWSIPTTPYSSASPIQSLPLLRSENECVQVVRNQRLEKSTCTETHLFRPFSNGQSGASTRIVQSLTYSQERRSDATPTDFKRTKASLIFDSSDASASNAVASVDSLKIVNELLEHLKQHTQSGIVSPQVPALFSQLVTSLKSFSYRQLSELMRTHQTSSAYKFLTDAAPLMGTAASYQLMREVIDDGLLTDLEIDLWLTSLAFQTRPTLDMIAVLSPMLDDELVRPKALLSISAVIYGYCRHRAHEVCLSEPIIRQAITSIERRLSTSDQQTVVLVLKALGNAGLVVSSAETIKKFYMAEDKSMQIRLAAIESLRRVPCEADDRSSLLALYRDSGRDSELRIGAYLGAIRCPTQRLLDVVKQSLDAEPVNQVGSFVWTHLTNLQESQSPAKQAVRRLLASDTLRNKFQTDVRKFSRNFEASTFWPDTNVGGSVESNLIFSSRSYLPRSASLNLTVDLFGQSVNLLELGARLEGFEPLVESLFGPDGLYPDETLQKTLQSMRSERSSAASTGSVDQSLNQLMAVFDAKSQIAEKPRGDIYVRIFGNELLVQHVHSGLLSKHSSPSALLALLMDAVRQGDIDFSKSVSLIDTSYVLPTVAGLPLSLSVNATATVSFGMGGTYRTAAGLSDLEVTGHVKPSASVDVNGFVTISASTFARSGVRIQNAMHTATSLSGKLIVRGTRIVSVHLDAPQEASHVFSYDSKLFLLQTSRPNRPVPSSGAAQINGGTTTTFCSSNWLGVELCGRLEQRQNNNAAESPRGLLAGPAHAALFLRKTDTHSSYVLDFQRDGLRSLSLMMDTPQSQVDRRVRVQFELDEAAKTLKASFLASPLFGPINTELTGRYEFNSLMKAVDVALSIDSAQIASIRAALRTDLKGPTSGRIEPSLVVTKAGSDLLHFQGYYSYSAGSKYGFDFQLKHLTVRPIRFTGDISKDSEKYDASIGVKSYFLDTSVAGTIRRTDKMTTCKAKTDYSIMEGTSHSVEVSTKYSRAQKGLLSRTAVSAVIQGSQYPQLDTDVSWELQTSEGYVENSARLSTGGDQWELHQLYKVQPGVVQLRAGITCRQQNVDLLAHVTLQSNQAEFSGLAGWQLSSKRKWSTKVDLTFQPQRPARYAVNLELVSPIASRQFRSKIVQNERENYQWDLLIEYLADQQVGTSLTAVYKNLGREGIKLEHSVDAKLRSSFMQNLHLTALLAASPMGTQVGFSTTYGSRKSSGEVDYTRHSQLEHSINARFTRDDEVLGKASFNLNLAKQRRSLSVDIETGRKITLDAFLASSGEGSLSIYWDRSRDVSRHLEISGQFLVSNDGKARALLKYATLSPIRLEIDSFVNEYRQNMTALLEWQVGKAIIMEMQMLQQQTDGSKRFNGQLSTPFASLPLITLDGLHTATSSQLDSRWALDWQRDRLSFSLTGSRTAENVRGAFKMSSTVSPLLEDAGLEFQAATTRSLNRYSLTVQHLGRQFELLADCRRRERFFSSASIRLATPIRGYESLSMSVGHTQRVNNFETQVQLEGPLASRATVTLSAGKKIESHETDVKLSISTSFAALQTSSFSFRLINARSKEKKLKVEAEYNGQHLIVADAAADLSDAEQFRAQLRLDTAYTEQVTASIQHRHRSDGSLLLTQGRVSWAGGLKSALISLDGLMSSGGQMTFNVTLTAPGLVSNARLDHRRSIEGQVAIVVETEANGRKASLTLDAQSLSSDDLRFDCSMSVPFSGFENLRLGVEHRRPTLDGKSKAVITRIQGSKDRQRLSLQHDVEFRDAFNWANSLAVEQDSSASSPLFVITNKQTWSTSGKFQHETEIRFQDADKVRFELNVDSSKTGHVTSSGSLVSTWATTDNVSFLLEHTDDGLEFHPILTVSTSNGGDAPIRFEVTYRRGPNNPSLTTELSGSSSYPPVKLSAAFINADTPLKTAKVQLNWNSDRYVDWSLDWKLAMGKSHVATRLLTPFNGYSHIEGEISYDSTGPRKTALARLAGPNKPEQSLLRLEAFAAGQGSIYRSELSLVADQYVQPVKVIAVLDLAGARASLQMDRNQNQLIRLQGVLSVTPTQTSISATVETLVDGWRNVKVEGTLKANREIVIELDADERKMSLSGSFSVGLGKGAVKGAVKTTFNSLATFFQTASLDASYDASNSSAIKTGQITLMRNEQTMQASAQLTYLSNGVKVTINVKAPCCGIRHLEVSGSYDESTSGRKTGHFKLDMNGEKYQLDGHLLNAAAGHGEISLKTLTGRVGYEQVSVSAKYDVRQSASRTAEIAFSQNSDRFHLSAAANTHHGPLKTDVTIDLSTPIEAYRSMRLDCRYDLLGGQSSTSTSDEKTASIIFVRNGQVIRLSATGLFQSSLQGKLDWTLETPFSGWQRLQGQLALDVSARTLVFVAHTIRAEVEWSHDRLVIRSNTPFTGFEVLNLNCAYELLLNQKQPQLRASLLLERNQQKAAFRFAAMVEPTGNGASFELESPLADYELLSGSVNWNWQGSQGPNSINLQAAKNSLTLELNAEAMLSRNSSDVRVRATSSIEGWRSTALSVAYDLRSPVSARFSLTREEPSHSSIFSVGMVVTDPAVVLTIETPFESYEKISAKFTHQLDEMPQKSFFKLEGSRNEKRAELTASTLWSLTGKEGKIEAIVTFKSNLVGWESATAEASYKSSPTTPNHFAVNCQLTTNGRSLIDASAVLHGLQIECQLHSPLLVGYERLNLRAHVQLSDGTGRLVVERNAGDASLFEASGALTGRSVALHLQSAISGWEVMDLDGNWDEERRKIEFNFACPSLVEKIALTGEYQPTLARLLVNHGNWRYRNEVLLNSREGEELGWRAAEVVLTIQLPVINALRNVSSSLSYNFVRPAEKTMMITLNDSHHRYEATGRLNFSPDFATAVQAVIHIQTPLTGYEEMDLSVGYDFPARTAFFVSERNGKSVLLLKAIAAFSPSASNLSGTIRIPALLAQDVDMVAAYFVASDLSSADARFKLLDTEVLLDGRRSDGWSSALATVATTFHQLRNARINWDGTDRTVALQLESSWTDTAIDARLPSWDDVEATASVGDHTVKAAWKASDERLSGFIGYDNTAQMGSQMYTDFAVNYTSPTQQEDNYYKGDYLLTVQHQASKSDLKLTGRWSVDRQAKDISGRSALFSNGASSIIVMETSFNGQFSKSQSAARLTLLAPSIISPVDIRVDYDAKARVTASEYDRLVFNSHVQMAEGNIYRVNYTLAARGYYDYDSKVTYSNPAGNERVFYSFCHPGDSRSNRPMELIVQQDLDAKLHLMAIIHPVESRASVTASLTSAKLTGPIGWNVRLQYVAQPSLFNTSAIISWAEEDVGRIAADAQLSGTQLSATLTTPFEAYRRTQFVANYNFLPDSAKRSVDWTLTYGTASQSITVMADWEASPRSGRHLISVRLTTPFPGYEQMVLRGTLNAISTADFSSTISFSRADQVVHQLTGHLTANTAGTMAKISFNGAAGQDLSVVIEYDLRSQKKTASLLVLDQDKRRFAISAAGQVPSSDKFNCILTVESSDNPVRIFLDFDTASAEKNGRATVEWGEQQRIELACGWTPSNKVRLTLQTPWENLRKMSINGRVSPKAFDASFDYGRNRKVQLTGQYRLDSSLYSINGTLQTPWIEPISWQSFLDRTASAASASVSWAEKKFASVQTSYRSSASLEVAIQSSHPLLRDAKLSAVYDLARQSKRLALGGEYNGREASFDASFDGIRTASLRGTYNKRSVALDALYHNDGKVVKIGTNVTTPFVGFEHWSARLLAIKQSGSVRQNDFSIHVETPLASLPSVDTSLRTVFEAGRRLEVDASLSSTRENNKNARARFELTKDSKMYVVGLELDAPLLESYGLRTIKSRAECQLDSWKNVVISATTGIPSGEYSARASILLARSNININAGIKTPTISSRSIEMGAGYHTTDDLSLLQGELFLWDNKVEGRMEKRNNQVMTGEIIINLPIIKLASTRLHGELNYRSARQLQATLGITQLQHTHTASLSYQLSGSKFTGNLDIESPLLVTSYGTTSKKSFSFKTNFGDRSAMSFESKMDDHCHLIGSLRIASTVDGSIDGRVNLNCPNWKKTINLELAATWKQGKLIVATSSSVEQQHQFAYKIDRLVSENGGLLQVSISAESPAWIEPLHLQGMWQNGEGLSLNARYGRQSHSIRGSYAREGAEGKMTGSIIVASPYLPGSGEASLHMFYHRMEASIQLDLLGQRHRMECQLKNWPGLGARFALDSPLLSWQSLVVNARAEYDTEAKINVTFSYGEKNLGIAGRARYAAWNDMKGFFELTTPFQTLPTARLDANFLAPNARRINVTVNLQTSHPSLPQASFNTQYHFTSTQLETSVTLKTPFARWEEVGVKMTVPLTLSSVEQKQIALLTATMPSGTRYSVVASLHFPSSRRQLDAELELDCGGGSPAGKFSARVLLKADDIYQARLEVTTPVRGFENYLWDLKGQADVKRWGESSAFLDWNGERIEFKSNLRAEPMAYVAVVQVKTPIAGFERYGLRVRLEGTERKSLTLELESPLWKAGADFDYHLKTATDFICKASVRTPLSGYESFTLHLSNQLVTDDVSLSLHSNAEARFAHLGLASNVEAVLSRNGLFRLSADGRYNEQMTALKTSGRLDGRGVSCTMNLTTPFSQLANLDTFVQFERDLSNSRGMGLSINGHEMIHVSLVHQSETGLWLLSVNNPWRPVDVAFSWRDESSNLIHYHAQLCWDLHRRSQSTLGARLVVNTTSYGRQVNIETVTPRRRVRLDYALQVTSTKVDHSIAFSWAPEKKAGYHIFAEDRSSLTLLSRRSQLSGSVRLDLPARSFQLEMEKEATPTASSSNSRIEFLWDAKRDVTQRIGARLETEITTRQRQQSRQVRLILLHPSALEQNIVLTAAAKYGDGNSGDLNGFVELVYSPQPDHRFLLQGSVLKVTNGRQFLLSVVHPVSHTNMRLQANATRLRGSLQPGARYGLELAGRLDYSDRFSNVRFLYLGARIEPEQRRLSMEARTADGAMTVTNALSVGAGGYGIASHTVINDVEALTVDGRLGSSSVQLDAQYAGGKAFNFFAGMPDRREVTVRASRDIYGRQITDGLLQLRLNSTNLLSSRLHWRSSSLIELRRTLVSGLVQVLATSQLMIDDVRDFTAQEWSDKRSSLAPSGRFIVQRLADNMNSQLRQFGSEFNAMADEWAIMYEQNDFYMRDVLSAVGQVASLARPFVERSVASVGALARALSVESITLYRFAHDTIGSLARAASSAYLQASSYVYGALKETVRSYNHLTALVMERFFKCEIALGRFIEQTRSAYLQMAGRLEEIVMQRVDELRSRFIELVTSYTDKFQPWIEYFNDTIDNARVYYHTIIRSIQDWRQRIHERLMTHALFQRLHAFYLEYATWLEEFHFQDYVDQYTTFLNRLKEEMRERFQSVASRYQPLIDPIVEALNGQMEAFKQMPIVMYSTKAIERLSLQINEFSKYVELEAQLRLILRQTLQKTDRLVKQLAEDLKGSLNVPAKPTLVLDWDSGHLEWSQRLPFTWETFDTLPLFRELPLLRSIAKARRNLLREMDYTQLYFSVMNAFATYKPLRLRTILPPFGSHASLHGTQHYMTFDGRHYDFAGECSYLLVSDFFRNDFSVVVNYESVKGASKVTRKSITILSDGRKVEVDSSSFRVTVNGRKIEMPLSYEGTNIWRDGQRVLVTNERGYRIDCNLYRDTCSVHVPGWSFGKTGGLFGVFNNEPADDFLTPFRQQRSDEEIDSFASSWKVGTARCRVRNYASTVSNSKASLPSPTAKLRNSICDPLFTDGQSVLRPCFQVIDPTPYARMCINDLAALANSAKKDLGVCTAAAAYVNECRLAGLDLFMPPQCVRCELENGQVMGSGEMRTLQPNEVPRSADVVFIVEQKPCVNGTRLSNLPAAIDSALRELGIEQNRFAVVGFGGRGELLNRPHVRTAEGEIWANRKSIQLALEDMPLDWQQKTHGGGKSQISSSDINAALRYAVNLPYRVGVSKQFVLVSCAGSECQASSYADTLTLLIENDIKLHLLQPRDLVVKGRNSSEEIKNVFGLDAEDVYTARNVRSLKGDRELRRQLAIPKDFCTPLALETNGTLFDLKKMVMSDVTGPTSLQAKKFVDIFARRVAATGEPSPCQRCDCIGDRDGVGAVLCQRCISPVLERLDKVWEQLLYENDIENEPTNLDEVSVVSEISIEKPTISAKKNTTTVPIKQ